MATSTRGHDQPRTPTALKVLRGETRRSRLPGRDAEGRSLEPQPRDGLPVMPTDLSPGAQRYWKAAMDEIGQAGVLKGADAAELRVWAEAMDRYQVSQSMLVATGPLVTGRHPGELIKNPLHQVVRDNARLAHELARSLGLSPSGRASLLVGALPVTPNAPAGPRLVEDPIAELLNPRRLAAKRAAAGRTSA